MAGLGNRPPHISICGWASCARLKIGAKQRHCDELQKQIVDASFWSDQARSSKINQQRARLEESLELDNQVKRQLDDVQALIELAREGEPVVDELGSHLKETEAFV